MTSSECKTELGQERGRQGTIVHNAYGKSKIRLTKVSRHPDRHDLKELCIDIQLEGDFEDTYLTGDNKKVIATDSMKNTVYVLAAEHKLADIESFAKKLASHFVKQYVHVQKATVFIAEELWQRIELNGKPHPHAFSGAGAEKRTTEVVFTKDKVILESGISDLRVVKTTDSAFEGFVRDQYTTLPEVKDRIFGTTISATWLYSDGEHDFNALYDTVRLVVLEVFASHMSLSVQQTLHEIGQQALARCAQIKEITLQMPNEHRIPFILQNFGVENRNEIAITTGEPYGLIMATIARK